MSRRYSFALLAALLAAGLTACSIGRHDSNQPAVAGLQTDATRKVAPGPPPPPDATKTLGKNNVSLAASPEAGAMEDQFFAFANAARAAAHIAVVSRDPDLDAYARDHVKAMADRGRIYHSNIDSLLGPWWMIGENVGVGPDAQAIETAYVRSPSHYANLVDSAFKYAGVGVVIVGKRVFTVEIFGI